MASPAPPAPSATAPVPTRAKLLMCVVTAGRQEASAYCAISLLNFQNALMCSEGGETTDMHFVTSLDDALNALHADADAAGLCVIDAMCSFNPTFPVSALNSGLPVVLAAYPLPVVDWERVKRRAACDPDASSGEPAQHWGNVYNVAVGEETVPGASGEGEYARAEGVTCMRVAWISKAALADVVSRHPEVLTSDGSAGAFALRGVYDGQRQDGVARFLSLYGGAAWVDLQRPAGLAGPLEFGGCVGARDVLR